jgi:hypothetical protein
VEDFNPYVVWFGIATRSGRPNHYALLGVAPFEPDTSAIVAAADRRIAILAGLERGAHEPLRQKLIAEVTRAKQTLTDVALKKQYDESLRQKAIQRSTAPLGSVPRTEFKEPPKSDTRKKLPGSDQLPPRANSAGPPLPEEPAAGDPMAPIVMSAPGDPIASVTSERFEQTAVGENQVGQISDQLASARLAARKLAVRRQKAPYWVIASLLGLIVVVGVALAVAYANGLIHIGPLPQVAERNDSDPEERVIPALDTAAVETAIEPHERDAELPTTKTEVEPASREPTPSRSEPSSDATAPKPADPPIDPEQQARLTAELVAARKALGERNIEQAKQHIATSAKLAASGEQKKVVEGFQALPKYVDGFWEAVREGLKGLEQVGELKVGNTYVSIVEVGSSQLKIRASGKNHSHPLDDLPAGLAIAIAKRWFDDRPDNKVYLGAFYFVDPRVDVAEAKRLWEEAASAGIDVKGLLALLPIAAKE